MKKVISTLLVSLFLAPILTGCGAHNCHKHEMKHEMKQEMEKHSHHHHNHKHKVEDHCGDK